LTDGSIPSSSDKVKVGSIVAATAQDVDASANPDGSTCLAGDVRGVDDSGNPDGPGWLPVDVGRKTNETSTTAKSAKRADGQLLRSNRGITVGCRVKV
jgi:hypothetical protein